MEKYTCFFGNDSWRQNSCIVGRGAANSKNSPWVRFWMGPNWVGPWALVDVSLARRPCRTPSWSFALYFLQVCCAEQVWTMGWSFSWSFSCSECPKLRQQLRPELPPSKTQTSPKTSLCRNPLLNLCPIQSGNSAWMWKIPNKKSRNGSWASRPQGQRSQKRVKTAFKNRLFRDFLTCFLIFLTFLHLVAGRPREPIARLFSVPMLNVSRQPPPANTSSEPLKKFGHFLA